eukprot:363506-Chlamydomonas_euryale.AAC.15
MQAGREADKDLAPKESYQPEQVRHMTRPSARHGRSDIVKQPFPMCARRCGRYCSNGVYEGEGERRLFMALHHVQ